MQFMIEMEPETAAIRGNALCSDEPELDREAEDLIIDRVESGDAWAWCCVRVYVELENGDHVHSSWLGGCSYADEDDFRANSGYFDDMCEEIRATLRAATKDSES